MVISSILRTAIAQFEMVWGIKPAKIFIHPSDLERLIQECRDTMSIVGQSQPSTINVDKFMGCELAPMESIELLTVRCQLPMIRYDN